jgi:hypothetical protein
MINTNPYHPLSPPDDPSLFYGRQEAISFLRQHLVGIQHEQALVILGRAGMGKTALLHQSPYVIDERYISVYLNLADLAPLHTSRFLEVAALAIIRQMEAIGAETYRIPPLPSGTDEAAWRAWFAKDFLGVVLTAIRRDRYLLLLIDHLEQLWAGEGLSDAAELIAYWGDLLSQYERLDMALACDLLEEARLHRYPVLNHLNQHLRLLPLDEAAARQLMTDPLNGAFTYSPEALARLRQLCGGSPFLIHSACRLIYRQYELNPQLSQVTPPLIEGVYPAMLAEAGEIMGGIWENSSPAMQFIWQALAELCPSPAEAGPNLEALQERAALSDLGLNATQVLATLRSLDYWSLIKANEEGRYSFATELEGRYLAEMLAEQQHPPKKAWLRPKAWLGLLLIAAAVALVLLILALGVLNGEPETHTPPIEPTSTLALEIRPTP